MVSVRVVRLYDEYHHTTTNIRMMCIIIEKKRMYRTKGGPQIQTLSKFRCFVPLVEDLVFLHQKGAKVLLTT